MISVHVGVYDYLVPKEVADEIQRLREDQQDWRKGVALIASALGYKDADLSCVGIADAALTLRAEIERGELQRRTDGL